MLLLLIVQLESPETKLVLSGVVIRADRKDIGKKVASLNSKIKTFCSNNSIPIIDNTNILPSCLSNKKLHLNPKGLSSLAANFAKFIEKF